MDYETIMKALEEHRVRWEKENLVARKAHATCKQAQRDRDHAKAQYDRLKAYAANEWDQAIPEIDGTDDIPF